MVAQPAVDVEAALLEVVGEKTGYPADMLELDMDIEADLGIDSIKRVEIMGVLQERLGETVAAGPEQLGELRTLRHIVDFMAEAAGSAPACRRSRSGRGGCREARGGCRGCPA